MLPTVFLSLSGKDEAIVERVHEHLPDGLAYFYPRNFENGESLLLAMESRINNSAVFALFASRASVTSHWVKFEMDRARLAAVKRPNFRLLVFPIERDITYRDLPEWMQEYWIPKAGISPRDIARYIRSVLASAAIAASESTRIYGRGQFIDTATGQFQDVFLATKNTPNVFLFAGNGGIGRRTVARQFLEHAFPALREINYGPEFLLPQFADLADLYRALRQEIDVRFSLKGFQADLESFANLTIEQRAIEIAKHIAHFGQLGQAVTIATGNGIYEDRGILKPWAPILFEALARDRQSKLCIVANRQIHEHELRPHSNVLQFYVSPLHDADIRTLMIAMASEFNVGPQVPGDAVTKAIGGHPGIAKAATRLIAQTGALVLENDMRSLFNIQEEVLSESLDFERMSSIERDVLSILSWVPQLNGQMLKDAIVQRHQLKNDEFAGALSNLILACLVLTSGPNYLISSPIRGLFRRKHGYGSAELRNAFSQILQEAWKRSAGNDELKTELFDAIVFMTAIEGGTLPQEFKKLLLPSALQEVIRETYDRGHDDEDALRRVVSWGLPAKEMRMDETTREEILTYVVRAQTRLQSYDGAQETLAFMDARSYRSRFYIRSFYVRYSGGDLKHAIILLRKARAEKKYQKRVIADLALCYQKLGMACCRFG